MKFSRASLYLLLIQLAIVSTVAGKYLYQRWSCQGLDAGGGLRSGDGDAGAVFKLAAHSGWMRANHSANKAQIPREHEFQIQVVYRVTIGRVYGEVGCREQQACRCSNLWSSGLAI
jgi:hypothetical protein